MNGIPTQQYWQPALNGSGVVAGVDDINQCLSIILKTPKGADPHRPWFGCDAWRYLDQPATVALPHIVREAVDAINACEPRITLNSVKPQASDIGAWIVLIKWSLPGGVPQTTQVGLQW
jgi:phage baseplate assembly protein W